MKRLSLGLAIAVYWAGFAVAVGVVARVGFELAVVGFTFGGLIPFKP